jgi:hypothetical protein
MHQHVAVVLFGDRQRRIAVFVGGAAGLVLALTDRANTV